MVDHHHLTINHYRALRQQMGEQQVKTNILIPPHRKIEEAEVEVLLERYNIESPSKLPRIKIQDPALAGLELELGDVVEITRSSFAGETKYYRVVVQ